MAYLEAVRKEDPIPEAPANDERLRKLSQERLLNRSDEGEDEADDWDDVEEDPDEDEFEAGKTTVRSRRRDKNSGRSQDLKEYLLGMTKETLVDFLQEIAERIPEVRESISDRAQLERGSWRTTTASWIPWGIACVAAITVGGTGAMSRIDWETAL